jgi:outer membrane lipoprotein-sorting protein
MMTSSKSVAAALAVAVLVAGIYGCKDGPAEHAGKQVDKAVNKVEDAVKK